MKRVLLLALVIVLGSTALGDAVAAGVVGGVSRGETVTVSAFARAAPISPHPGHPIHPLPPK